MLLIHFHTTIMMVIICLAPETISAICRGVGKLSQLPDILTYFHSCPADIKFVCYIVSCTCTRFIIQSLKMSYMTSCFHTTACILVSQSRSHIHIYTYTCTLYYMHIVTTYTCTCIWSLVMCDTYRYIKISIFLLNIVIQY